MQYPFSLPRLPETFNLNTCSDTFREYVSRKYSNLGFSRSKAIEYNPEWTPEGSFEKWRWVENPRDGLRFVGASHEIVNLRHTGHYTDSYHDESVHGEVYQLPARHGEPQYIPAISDPNSDGRILDFHSCVTSDKEEAARCADSMAEKYAEAEREYQAKDAGEQRLAEIQEEIKALHRAYRATCKEIRAAGVSDVAPVRSLLRSEWTNVKAKVQRLRKERRKIEDNGGIWE